MIRGFLKKIFISFIKKLVEAIVKGTFDPK